MEITLINSEDQKHAEQKLAKYYENNLIPAEKKAYLTELSNNNGPFMGIETKNGDTHYLMDAASQIATLGLGFSPSVFMGTAHHKAAWNNNPYDTDFLKVKDAFHSFLMRKTGWKHLDMTICNSGAESNEIALGYAFKRRQNKNANKVLAFDGSFHGRMLISLFSTWNPSKREPFQWKGYETLFNSYPELPGAEIHQEFPKDWRDVWDQAPSNEFTIPNEWKGDVLLSEEVKVLEEVRENLLKGEVFAIIIEPMQCEGGDRYASDRFHTALLTMAKSFNVATIYDEVQTGFHLGREFFWHRQFNLTDEAGNQLNPDYLVCAKKAQVGLVLSPHDLKKDWLESNQQYQVASVIRGYYHGLALDQSRLKIYEIEAYAKEKLAVLCEKFSSSLTRPRTLGLSFAFDLPDADTANTFIAKRFEHGLLYYPAGAKTLRFRLNTSYETLDIDFLFERLEAIAEEILNGNKSSFNGIAKTKKRNQEETQSLQHFFLEERLKEIQSSTVTVTLKEKLEEIKNLQKTCLSFNEVELKECDLFAIDKKNFSQYAKEIETIQQNVYEPARQTELERFRVCAESEYSVCLGFKFQGTLIGIAFASSLKDHPLERGLRQDPDFENPKSLYMIDTTVLDQYRSVGLGRYLKFALAALAKTKGYTALKGRNRDKLAGPMLNINLSLGSYESNFLREDYPDFEEFRDVVYYTTPLNWNKSTPHLGNRLESGLEIQDISPEYLRKQLPYLTNKVCLSNFVSENFLAHVKAISEQAPEKMRHIYTASGQSECADKALKSIVYNTENFNHNATLLTFKGHFFGSGSFLSRSLSGDCGHEYFPVTKLENPDQTNWKEVLGQVKELIKGNKVNSIWIEPTPQNSYRNIPKEFLKELVNNGQIPVIYNETGAQQFQYAEDCYFASNDSEICPDISFAFLGGQAGIVMLQDNYFVSKPLMMISTWDGDEHAFATYKESMNKILANKEAFLKERQSFNTKLESILKKYPNLDYSLSNGRGFVQGPLPYTMRQEFKPVKDGFVIDPSFEAMKCFNK